MHSRQGQVGVSLTLPVYRQEEGPQKHGVGVCLIEGGFGLELWNFQELLCCAEIGQCFPYSGQACTPITFSFLIKNVTWACVFVSAVCLGKEGGKWGDGEGEVEVIAPGRKAAKSNLPREQSPLASPPPAFKISVGWWQQCGDSTHLG